METAGRWLASILLTAAITSNAYAEPSKPPRPNIVLILCDDLGFSDLGCYGGEIRTPNLDQLAADGLRFRQFYNCAVCVTTRSSLISGLHPRHGGEPRLRENMATVAEVLRSAGYRTSLTGKWHLGHQAPQRPTDRGFEEYYGVASGCCNYFDPYQPDPKFYNGGKRRPFLHNQTPVTQFPDDYYMTDAFTDHAIEQIQTFSQGKSPFFVHLCYTAALSAARSAGGYARYAGKYSQGYFKLREERHQRQKELGILDPSWKLSKPDHRLGEFRYDYDITPWESVEDRIREERRMEVYAAMVDRMDQGIGRVLKSLEASGVADNTVVLFLSDNGGCASYPAYNDPEVAAGHAAYNQELPGGKNTYDFCGPGWGWAQCTPFRRYKVWTYEGGIATPMIAYWPGVTKAGTFTDQVGHVVDLMPTLMELAGAEYPATKEGKPVPPAEGQSLVPALQGEVRDRQEPLCWYLMGNRAIRIGKWKLVWGVTGGRWELYDMQADRTETNNLAAKYPQRVKEMAELWTQWARTTEVPVGE